MSWPSSPLLPPHPGSRMPRNVRSFANCWAHPQQGGGDIAVDTVRHVLQYEPSAVRHELRHFPPGLTADYYLGWPGTICQFDCLSFQTWRQHEKKNTTARLTRFLWLIILSLVLRTKFLTRHSTDLRDQSKSDITGLCWGILDECGALQNCHSAEISNNNAFVTSLDSSQTVLIIYKSLILQWNSLGWWI